LFLAPQSKEKGMAGTQFTALATEVRDGVYILRLNRPTRKNAFNREMYEECILALTSAAGDDSVRALVRVFIEILMMILISVVHVE